MAHLKTDTGGNAHYASVPTISHSRNSFSVAERHLTSIQFDGLYPVYQKYIYPGDTLSIQHSALARLQTQIATLFDDLYFDIHAWFVPMRLIQPDWAEYQFNAQPQGPTQDNSSLVSPQTNATTKTAGFTAKSLWDYFGYPTGKTFNSDTNYVSPHINVYPLLAYNKIWNDNYRDENLQAPITNNIITGEFFGNTAILKRGKRHDMFTSCLTAPQKGPASTIPVSFGTLPVTRVPLAQGIRLYNEGTNTVAAASNTLTSSASLNKMSSSPAGANLSIDPNGGLQVVVNQLQAFTVNQLRTSVAVQHLLEADARGGTRDVEAIKNRWGVQVPDFRMQRPEYLGGQTFSFDGHIVPQTSASEAGSPQATLKQFSQTTNAFNFTHSFVEHGVVMILLSARSNITYQQGLPKEYSYKTRFDWYQPEFANLGEVAVKNKEIYFQGRAPNSDIDELTFGYQEYGYELRYGLNKVTSEFRSNYATSLDLKHMADYYASLPTLSPAWIQSNTAISRNIAVSATIADPIEINMLVTGTIARTLPMYSVPGLNRL